MPNLIPLQICEGLALHSKPGVGSPVVLMRNNWIYWTIGLMGCGGGLASENALHGFGSIRDTEIRHEACATDGSSAQGVDANGDSKPDLIRVVDGSAERCRAVDLNFDGVVDTYVYFDETGKERRRESDFDRDGVPDEIAHLQAGVVTRKDRETNFDKKLDTWDFFAAGGISRRERDADGDGIVDQWWQFPDPANSKCATVASDRNADGRPDPDTVVDLCADVKPQAAAESAPPAAAPSATPAAGSSTPAAPAAPPTTAEKPAEEKTP